MDPELQKKIDAARADGYSDEEINAYLGLRTNQAQAQAQGQPVPPDVQPQPPIDRYAEEKTAGLQGAAALGAGALATGALGAGAYRVAKPMAMAALDAARQAKAPPVTPSAPVAPSVPSQLVDQYGRPMSVRAPVAPATPPAAAQPAGVVDRTANMMRQIAANRVVQGAVRGAGAAGLALHSGELGPKTPQVGRMRGMEINPMTRQPWTPEQIRMYEANPAQFDMYLGAAQMPR